ncbi:MAG: hypothetical protein ACEQSM_03085 [Aliarcobacter sp.]
MSPDAGRGSTGQADSRSPDRSTAKGGDFFVLKELATLCGQR